MISILTPFNFYLLFQAPFPTAQKQAPNSSNQKQKKCRGKNRRKEKRAEQMENT